MKGVGIEGDDGDIVMIFGVDLGGFISPETIKLKAICLNNSFVCSCMWN
jgi:hypothetical protein